MRLIRLTIVVLAIFAVGLTAQARFQQPPITDPNWTKPFDPFRIVGNFYYVGGYDLACFLITTTDGNILVNTGLDSSVSMIRANIESLGFKFADTKMLLATHAHFDHVAAMAELKRLTGARMLMNEADAQTLEDGGDTDYRDPDGRGNLQRPRCALVRYRWEG